jgi:hypothetical protein
VRLAQRKKQRCFTAAQMLQIMILMLLDLMMLNEDPDVSAYLMEFLVLSQLPLPS